MLRLTDETAIISIHSLRAEGDNTKTVRLDIVNNISIHSLRAEGDVPLRNSCGGCGKFQSTPSVRRETNCRPLCQIERVNFNPLPPCGGRQNRVNLYAQTRLISIHSLRAEGDARLKKAGLEETTISIHSLRAEGD